MEDSGGTGHGRGSFFACYLLTSLNPRFKGCHYIGFTVNPRRRIRQHNGELTSGAWRTHRKRPWDMVLCLYGFSSQVEALQFEWAWQHPMKSLAVKEAAGRIPSSVRGLKKQFYLLFTMLNCDKWSSMDLNVQFLSSKYIDYRKGCPGLPPHMGLSIAPVDSLPMNLEEADSESDDMEKEGIREVSNVEESVDSFLESEPIFSDIEEDDMDLPLEFQDCRRGEIGRPKSLNRTKKQRVPPDMSIGDAAASSSRASTIAQPLANATNVSGRQGQVKAANVKDGRQAVDIPASVDFTIRKAPVDDDVLLINRYRQLPGSSLGVQVEAPVPVSLNPILETSPRTRCRPKNMAAQNVQGQSSCHTYDWHEKVPSCQVLSPLPRESGAVASETSLISPFSAFLDRYPVLEPSSIVKRCLQQKSNAYTPILPESSLPIRNLSNEDLPENLPRTPPCKPRVVVIIPDDTPIWSSREVIDLTDSPH
ncbi:hypothetical protein M758_2G122100 [Ceratodon purpureus]|nr:hypothetical protein M758_2G122100 [Ceratodon purpureus]